VLQLCYSVFSASLQWCDSGVTMVLQGCHNSITMLLQLCYSGVTVVTQWRYSVVTVVLMTSRVRSKGTETLPLLSVLLLLCACHGVREHGCGVEE
jgi:hypothetical protein